MHCLIVLRAAPAFLKRPCHVRALPASSSKSTRKNTKILCLACPSTEHNAPTTLRVTFKIHATDRLNNSRAARPHHRLQIYASTAKFGMYASCCTTVRGLFAFATPVFPKRYVHGHTALSSCAAMLGLLREGPDHLYCTRTCACACAGGRRWAPPHFTRTIACRVHIM